MSVFLIGFFVAAVIGVLKNSESIHADPEQQYRDDYVRYEENDYYEFS